MTESHEIADDIEARLNGLCGSQPTTTPPHQSAASVESHVGGAMADPSVVQHVVRTESAATKSGQTVEALSGSFRCRFEKGQSVHVLHVPIYPPMQNIPEVDVLCDSESITCRVTEAKKFGLRIELRRGERDSAKIVEVEVTATANSDVDEI